MACCTFNPPLMAAASNSSSSSKSKSHLIQTRNSHSQAPMIQYHFSMIPLERVIKLPHPPLFSLLKQGNGIPSLAQCLFSSYSSADTHHHDDDQKNINIEAQDQGKDSVSTPSPLEDALVKVRCLSNWEWQCPGLRSRPLKARRVRKYLVRTINGFIIEGQRLLTRAHCLEEYNTSIVQVQKQGSENIYQAEVIAIANDFDLAMLTVSDGEFWEGVGCVELGDMPSLGDKLITMSYSGEGMNTITSNNGFVLDMVPFSHGELELPAFTVFYDSKFRKSGSAVFNENGKCVGMATEGPESIHQGRVISATIIKHFIQDYNTNGGFTDTRCG